MPTRDTDSASGEPTADLQHLPQRPRAGVYVRVFGEGLFVTHYAPRRGTLTIGRSRSADLQIDHHSLSRAHVRLHLEPPLRIEDLGSTNGTSIGSRPLTAHVIVEIPSGTVAEIGALMLQVAAPTESRPGPDEGCRARSAEAAASAPLCQMVQRVAPSMISVLLLGETGVGKGVMAEQIHRLSPRAGRPFLVLNCGAFPEALLESELFGHERGAFTGAESSKRGLLETADGGTVFLDEVGELSPSLQVKLLRVLEAKEITRVGGLKARPIDVRFLAATNRDLEAEVGRGRFREDLYFRLCGVSLRIPPLRERQDQILPLARDLIAAIACETGRPTPDVSPAAADWLREYHWPGNIRELRNVIQRALLFAAETILPEHLPAEKLPGLVATTASSVAPPTPVPAPAPPPSTLTLREQERVHILDALAKCGGNQRRAAEMLGISRNTLAARLAAYGVPRPRKG
jgi:two-component system, NtrC family, response regulator AtoC